jgi:hypothetical protein
MAITDDGYCHHKDWNGNNAFAQLAEGGLCRERSPMFPARMAGNK